MRLLITLMALGCSVALAAPKPIPELKIEAGNAVVDRVLIGEHLTAATEMRVPFVILVPAGGEYTVELWVESGGTGEKATLLRTATFSVEAGPKGESVKIEGTHTARQRARRGMKSQGEPPLPDMIGYTGWSYQLVLKSGKKVVSTTAFMNVGRSGQDRHVAE